jgi:membrane-bound lytic murein transglycosylase D
LLVPRIENRHADVSGEVADNATIALAPDAPPLRKQSVKAGRKDSVASLAKRYKVSPVQLAQWNNVATSATFKPGQLIIVYTGGGKTAARTKVALAGDAAPRKTTSMASAGHAAPATRHAGARSRYRVAAN